MRIDVFLGGATDDNLGNAGHSDLRLRGHVFDGGVMMLRKLPSTCQGGALVIV